MGPAPPLGRITATAPAPSPLCGTPRGFLQRGALSRSSPPTWSLLGPRHLLQGPRLMTAPAPHPESGTRTSSHRPRSPAWNSLSVQGPTTPGRTPPTRKTMTTSELPRLGPAAPGRLPLCPPALRTPCLPSNPGGGLPGEMEGTAPGTLQSPPMEQAAGTVPEKQRGLLLGGKRAWLGTCLCSCCRQVLMIPKALPPLGVRCIDFLSLGQLRLRGTKGPSWCHPERLWAGAAGCSHLRGGCQPHTQAEPGLHSLWSLHWEGTQPSRLGQLSPSRMTMRPT